ncbi:ubiquitin domain-containing protein DSK2b-like isoform X2 [Actinidia eriantha]|uniref:ubiquitin domain-containing protein DSK2b-like isoform X2 n=1 Tax=Actinidia eriantha TaxID=165200 RepID=UPI002589CB07|nr:ubiquitin domain-containing protein DSK2b-like isoform X2 [Actinidia eriantha]
MGGGDGGAGAAEVGDSENASCGYGVTVHVRCSNGYKFSAQIGLGSTVGSFKSVVAQNCDIPADQQRLIYKGRILKDDQTLESYGLEADHTVHLVRGFASATSTNSTGVSNPGVPNSTPSGVMSVGSDEGAAIGGSDSGASLFPGLGGSGGLFGAGIPEFEQVQQQLLQNPNLMGEIMNMPLAQNLMSNPDILWNFVLNNPQMREIIDRNPELAHVLNDPSTLRQTLEAARNPELMREMMRNTDRAMSNIESSPEGFNMLRRMYENVQEPFLNATTMAGDARSDLDSNPFAVLMGTRGGGQGTDQSTNPSRSGSDTTANSPAPNTNPLPNPWASGGAGSAETNSTTGSNTDGDARLPATGGLGGLGLPEFGSMLGSMQDTASLSQLMQNPAVSQMMQSLLSNPQNMNQQLLALRQALRSQLGQQLSTQESDQTGGGTGALDNMGLEMLMNMFSGLGTRITTLNRSNVSPEELYATQLSQLQEMGFFDTRENIQALIATAGNVHAAVERLLGNTGQ